MTNIIPIIKHTDLRYDMSRHTDVEENCICFKINNINIIILYTV